MTDTLNRPDQKPATTVAHGSTLVVEPPAEKAKPWFSLTGPELIGGALAATAASMLGSTLGTAGTLAGAGVGSVISAVAGQFFVGGLERGRHGLRVKFSRRDLVPTKEETAAPGPNPEADLPQIQAAKPTLSGRRLGIAVGALASAAAVFGLSMVVVTGVEAGTGRSLSGQQGTTVRNVLPVAAPSQEPSAEPTGDPSSAAPTPVATPTPEPTPSADPGPSVEPSAAPTTQETTAPATGAGVPTPIP